MADAVADPSERLPWLPDAPSSRARARPQPRQLQRSWYPLLLAVSAAGAIAFGGWSLVERNSAPVPAPAAIGRSETIPLPPPRITSATEGAPQAPSISEREALKPGVAEPIASERPMSRAKPAARRSSSVRRAQARRPATASAATAPAYHARAWASGVPGRIIQVGAFATSAQAQSEWRRVYSRYPLLRPLSPRVVKSRIRGRIYHRLQLGTFSHAHSELLCQRLRATGQGCIVLGMPARGRG